MLISARHPSSVSIEAGHFYAADFAEGTKALVEKFELIRPFVDAVASRHDEASVCFLFDDYHNRPGSKITPRQIYTQILEASSEAGITIDYIAREAAGVQLAPAFLSMLGRSGLLRFTEDQSWLLPSQKTPAEPIAMRSIKSTLKGAKPVQMSIELYDRPHYPKSDKRSWACPYLAAIWEGLRLGAIEDRRFNNPVIVSADTIPDWPNWGATPALVQFNTDVAPFTAQQATSVLPIQFLQVEGAVKSILNTYGDVVGLPNLDERVSRVHISD